MILFATIMMDGCLRGREIIFLLAFCFEGHRADMLIAKIFL